MRTATTLGAAALGLAVVFAGAVGVGQAVGPVGQDTAATADSHAGAHGDTHAAAPDAARPAGLSSSQDGHTLVLDTPSLPAGAPATLSFRVVGPDGEPVTAYTPTHDEDLHLVVVRRDGTLFQHVHPDLDAEGRWSVPVVMPAAGTYKVLADTQPAGRDAPLVLAADLQVAGEYAPAPAPEPVRTAQVDDYTVELRGDLVAGQTSPVVLRVNRDGRPVTDLQPYLAAYGHLVSLRQGDLAYVHTHPEGEPGDGRTAPGPDVAFGVDVPTAGTYRLFLDFRHDGVVRTAAFTAAASGPGAPHEH